MLSLTVIRMVPVAVSLAGRRLGHAAVAFVGWFGPRGLASVVFALLALEDVGHAAEPAVSVIAFTVLLSVVAHGLTANPLAHRYGPRLAITADATDDAEATSRCLREAHPPCSLTDRKAGHAPAGELGRAVDPDLRLGGSRAAPAWRSRDSLTP